MDKFRVGVALVCVCVLMLAGCRQQEASRSRSFVTSWVIKPSLKYDTCHLIGILTGRSLYQRYHPEVLREWTWNLPVPVRAAVSRIDHVIGPDWPPGPRLSLLLANVPADDSLSVILRAVQDTAAVRRALMSSDYGSQKNWQQWLALKPHVEVVLQHLITSRFEDYWRQKLLPELIGRIPGWRQELQAYDVVGDLERFLVDHRFRRDTVEVYILALGQPHELRLHSQARCTDVHNPLRATVRNFYHEMLHQYCDRLVDSLFVEQFNALEQDAFLREGLQRLAAGGNANGTKALFRKDLVLAAELWVAERRQLISMPQEAGPDQAAAAVRDFLRTRDNGAHVLAAVIYSYLEAGLKLERISYADFIRDLFASGRLRPGKMAGRYHDFMSPAAMTGE